MSKLHKIVGLAIAGLFLVECVGAFDRSMQYDDLEMFDTEARKRQHRVERPESFISAIEKVMYKDPMLKSKMFIFFKKHFGPNSKFMSSNPSAIFSESEGLVPDPYEVYSQFKSLIQADQMIKNDMQELLKVVQGYIDLMHMKRRAWYQTLKNGQHNLDEFKRRKARSTDEIASSEIDNQFAIELKKLHSYLKAYESTTVWEKKLSQLLDELFPA
ncbi:hypothetical protein NEHOM01_1455 [Nematocida homosporus]|uniref:uncharacterized protein n=1 Tax=Nematocida homosporus TaxID=1912981 RepID=UPI00221F47BA|nr:uncharacterized protein NEHOM01_1455 [Nematocida homosporus]KAI5186422.1 hypothetical protein NEHOM01_1455 [Nematocida homosporus]